MILIIDTGDKPTSWSYVHFRDDNKHVVLDGTFHVVAQFEVVERDDDGDASIIQELDDPIHNVRPS